ncbi:hypothetical protein QTP88_002483 [Uroleucon formosanum]
MCEGPNLMLHPVRVFDVQCGFPTRSTSHSETDRPNARSIYTNRKTFPTRKVSMTVILKNSVQYNNWVTDEMCHRDKTIRGLANRQTHVYNIMINAGGFRRCTGETLGGAASPLSSLQKECLSRK